MKMQSQSLLDRILPNLKGAKHSIMLYGSYARGDEIEESDIDVLQIVDKPTLAYRSGKFSISPYTYDHIKGLAVNGSLFVLHLCLEGRILIDNKSMLSDLLSKYIQPKNYTYQKTDLIFATQILDVNIENFEKNPEGYIRIALYLLRTWLYIQCIETSGPIFSMMAVSHTLGDNEIADIFTNKYNVTYRIQFFKRVCVSIENYFSIPINNRYKTMEALIIQAHGSFPVAESLALKVLGGETELNYTGMMV